MSILFDESIQMVDLRTQYRRLQDEIDEAVQSVLENHSYINGPHVEHFASNLAEYLDIPYVIPCGNGTDALQIALMALGLQAGDDVIVPAFSYIAPAEAVAMLGMTPVLVDVDPKTFNMNPNKIELAISRQTKAIIVVHLFGQTCDMEPILRLARKYNLYVIEDNAQSLGAEYTFKSGEVKKAGTIGDIGTTSFFPSKPLACYGDGGALFTSNPDLAQRIKMVANHGQDTKYHHQVIGCNSRLDTLQAAILDVKLNYFHEFTRARKKVAREYNRTFEDFEKVIIPHKASYSSHIYHQYTLLIKDGKREELRAYLKQKGIPTMVYYPLSLEDQPAMRGIARKVDKMPVARYLAQNVLSIPIHTEMRDDMVDYITGHIKRFFIISGE